MTMDTQAVLEMHDQTCVVAGVSYAGYRIVFHSKLSDPSSVSCVVGPRFVSSVSVFRLFI